MNCSICNISCHNEPLYRNNPKEIIPADWRCFNDLDNDEAIKAAKSARLVLIDMGLTSSFYDTQLGEPWHD